MRKRITVNLYPMKRLLVRRNGSPQGTPVSLNTLATLTAACVVDAVNPAGDNARGVVLPARPDRGLGLARLRAHREAGAAKGTRRASNAAPTNRWSTDGRQRAIADASRDPRRAARLVGACASVRESGGGVPPGWLKRRGQAVLTEAERVLGPAAARQAWEEGRRMSTAEAVAYASKEA